MKPNSKEAIEQLHKDAETILNPLGYDVIALEQSTHGGSRTVTLFIDFLEQNTELSAEALSSGEKRRISLEDCVQANRAVDELFENTSLLDGQYTLEVSSPGVERPLRKPMDYERFAGKRVRIHTYRPLNSAETENPEYWETHQKQKNFIGELLGTSGSRIEIEIDGQKVKIPLELVSKANLVFVEESRK